MDVLGSQPPPRAEGHLWQCWYHALEALISLFWIILNLLFYWLFSRSLRCALRARWTWWSGACASAAASASSTSAGSRWSSSKVSEISMDFKFQFVFWIEEGSGLEPELDCFETWSLSCGSAQRRVWVVWVDSWVERGTRIAEMPDKIIEEKWNSYFLKCIEF